MKTWRLWRLWWRKVVTGLAAILVVGFQMLGSVSTPIGLHDNGIQYAWSEQGLRATWLDVQPFMKMEEEVREDQLRAYRNRKRNKRGETAS